MSQVPYRLRYAARLRMLVYAFTVHACSKLLLACHCADSRCTCTVSAPASEGCLFLLHLSSRKCEGLKGNFNTSASISVMFVIGFSLRPIIIAATLLPWENFNIGFFSFCEVFVSRREAVRNSVIL